MIDPAILKAMVAAGATTEVIIAAVEAAQASEELRLAASREKNRLRQKRFRQGHPGKTTVTDATDVTRDRRYETLPTVSNGDSGRAISSSLSTFLLVDQPLKEGSKEVRSELVALDARDVSRVISDDWPADYESQFWAAYPRKIGRKAARAKLRTIRARCEVTFAALMAGVKQIPIGEAKFIPHPTTWLNQGRWEDDHSTQGSQNGSSGNVVDASRRLSERISAFTRGPGLRVEAGNADVRLLPQGGGERPGDIHGGGDADTGGLPHGGDRARH